jgi:hypothetical protein
MFQFMIFSGKAALAAEWGRAMTKEDDRLVHLERAAQCRRMADDAADPAVRSLHEQLAEFHEAEARRDLGQMAESDDHA